MEYELGAWLERLEGKLDLLLQAAYPEKFKEDKK